MIPCKNQFFGFFKIRVTRRNNIIATCLLVYVPSFIAYVYPYATKIFAIIGESHQAPSSGLRSS